MRILFNCVDRLPIVLLLLLLRVAARSNYEAQAEGSGYNRERRLTVLVPGKPIFTDFVECSDPENVRGFAVDVFQSALFILLSSANDGRHTDVPLVNYTCYNIEVTTSYDDLVNELAEDTQIDAVVGDLTISEKRMGKNLSFTQPFLDSNVVILTRAEGITQPFPGVLVKPFTKETWALILVSFFSTGVAFGLLEFQTCQLGLDANMPLREKLRKITWFVLAVLVFYKKESLQNRLSKVVLIAWIFFIFILGSGYLASFTSILTVWNLSQETMDLQTLRDQNLRVGYQTGSIVEDFLSLQNISNLVDLNNTKRYKEALDSGEVSAIVEEEPYVSLFLSQQPASACTYTVSQKLVTTSGFGFVFRDYDLSVEFSIAILNLSESGQLQKLQDGSKISNYRCPSQIQSTKLDVTNSYELFVLLGLACLACICVFVVKVVRRHHASCSHSTQLEDDPAASIGSSPHFNRP